ncbi:MULTISPECIES: tRNA uridine-5-carboxymethylaminomethyl(34) synthesis GTPase MnmE [Thermus]|uniref:tRNA modification GTPase MnmE n=2 Tax=Thermus thermophilus TaxID=274 RepID=MNME_THET8|nr:MULTISPECIES: tRNA uridine-5-carboxymethylaminomethyl(34) synthesis GTPase MnmE [Thermus]Q5SJS7.1 RecName: Full=tRNA modification GTPase MnmE [Thermus thermophilus HB8]QZY59404.1 tRNA uridine-5-carboxymethylaminomethyl(34) synthesis GTPase MnmE [Thermus thermophilus]BAD70754.1 thiophene and furan oxidation protein [Thermus thermophilus HB8]BCP66076.1 tRNA modification GTPase MnmE [Thermus thermophilus]BDA37553.1 tRNA modification GTPase MnmE [Thermus thermophilus]BDE45277.1 tRNA modificati
MNLKDPICAIATPPGKGAIGVVRLSGEGALEIAARVWRGKDPRRLKGGRFALGEVVDPKTGEAIDQAILLVFRAPRSYTGEDLVEFQTHGSPAVLRRVMEVLVAEGARPAGRGEFTFRAYLNGKMDLAQAEAVLALIEAEGELARRQALRALEGALSRRIEALENRLLNLLAHIQALLDYPEEGVEPLEAERTIREVLAEVEALLAQAKASRLAQKGARLALIGAPNAGKSSLLNALLGYERALVSPIPGTTRDYLEAPLELFGIPLVAVDTAGVRETEDPVERMGVERALGIAEEADLVLYVVDRSQPKPAPPPLPWARTLKVATKSDLPPAWEDPEFLPVSSLTGEGLDRLKEAVREALLGREGGEVLLTERQVEALLRARERLEEALSLPEDLMGLALEEAARALALLTGKEVAEEVVARVFQNFCVGK